VHSVQPLDLQRTEERFGHGVLSVRLGVQFEAD
jgi:hypothetical protein